MSTEDDSERDADVRSTLGRRTRRSLQEREEGKPSHPDYTGDVTIRGKKFWVSAWINELGFSPRGGETRSQV
jgi:hypothetical protein